MVDLLQISMTNALKQYHHYNNTWPDVIIVYRDGVGDSQLPVDRALNALMPKTISLNKSLLLK